jgi:hypothetical protein
VRSCFVPVLSVSEVEENLVLDINEARLLTWVTNVVYLRLHKDGIFDVTDRELRALVRDCRACAAKHHDWRDAEWEAHGGGRR